MIYDEMQLIRTHTQRDRCIYGLAWWGIFSLFAVANPCVSWQSATKSQTSGTLSCRVGYPFIIVSPICGLRKCAIGSCRFSVIVPISQGFAFSFNFSHLDQFLQLIFWFFSLIFRLSPLFFPWITFPFNFHYDNFVVYYAVVEGSDMRGFVACAPVDLFSRYLEKWKRYRDAVSAIGFRGSQNVQEYKINE